MSKPTWNRSLLALVVLLAAVLLLSSLAPPSQAATRSGHEFDYYSDATYTHIVGVQIWCNNGNHYGWGKITPYVKIYPSGC